MRELINGLNGPHDRPRKKPAAANIGSGGRNAIGIMLTAVEIRIVRISVLRESRALIHP